MACGVEASESDRRHAAKDTVDYRTGVKHRLVRWRILPGDVEARIAPTCHNKSRTPCLFACCLLPVWFLFVLM